jgi:hypothetical protein
VRQSEVERLILRLVSESGAVQLGYFITDNAHGLQQLIRARLNIEGPKEWGVYSEALWTLLARQLVFIGGDRSFGSCQVWPTERGKAVAAGHEFNPDDPNRYLERLLQATPSTSATVQQYLKEALKSYEQDCFLASAVMLGAAAEETTLGIASSFASWRGKTAEKFKKVLENPRQFYVYKLQEFEKQLAAAKGSIPRELSENLELNITTILQLIRLTRNDAGHPTGRRIDREDCHQNLVVYANAHQKLHRLKEFFESGSTGTQPSP